MLHTPYSGRNLKKGSIQSIISSAEFLPLCSDMFRHHKKEIWYDLKVSIIQVRMHLLTGVVLPIMLISVPENYTLLSLKEM